MLYSAVIQPLPEPFRNEGTDSSTDAVQMTRVLPTSISAEPSAMAMKLGTMLIVRIWSAVRLSERKTVSLFFNVNQFNTFYGAAQKLPAQSLKLFDRVSSITAQASLFLADVLAGKLKNSVCR